MWCHYKAWSNVDGSFPSAETVVLNTKRIQVSTASYGVTSFGLPQCCPSYASITFTYLFILYFLTIFKLISHLYFNGWRIGLDSREAQKNVIPNLQLKARLHLLWVKLASKSIPGSLVIHLVIYLLIDWKAIEWVRLHAKIHL